MSGRERTLLNRCSYSADPPSVLYSVLLTWHANLLSSIPATSTTAPSRHTSTSPSAHQLSPSDIYAALQLTSELNTLARQNGHNVVAQFATVLRLRTLVRAEMWHARANEDPNAGDSVANLLPFCERVLQLEFPVPGAPRTNAPDVNMDLAPEVLHLQMHTLAIGVIYYTLVGNTKASSPRLAKLHALLDASPPDAENGAYLQVRTKTHYSFQSLMFLHSWCLQINLGPTTPPLVIQTTHPRTIFELAFLVSSVSKRDLVGRKPRRRVFAEEGLRVSDAIGEDIYRKLRPLCPTRWATSSN